MTKSMSIHAAPGTRVRYDFPDAGYEEDRRLATKHLTVGAEYTVEATAISGFKTVVLLTEAPDEWFNSVHFAEAEAPEPVAEAPKETEGADRQFVAGSESDYRMTMTRFDLAAEALVREVFRAGRNSAIFEAVDALLWVRSRQEQYRREFGRFDAGIAPAAQGPTPEGEGR